MSISPRFETLEQAIASKDLEKVREAFKKMNSTWTINESVVRDRLFVNCSGLKKS
ncbi:TPA: hypothetical protein VUW75_002124 [Streptococcus pneumoniae]|nr:hypothetical protein [Streptococcus pneumoniae]HET8294311.1 hypothetical protein [Streptococcus pneumoniae]HEU1540103.1 hypothetical protein [Streptococcus pneumoniae]